MFDLKSLVKHADRVPAFPSLGTVARYVRGQRTPARPRPPYEHCATCGHAGADPGNSQKVPDPAQFEPRRKQGVGADGLPATSAVGTEKLPAVKDEAAIRYVEAPPVYCSTCGTWHHAIGCYSTHRH